MNENLFDNYIKDKLQNLESPVPEGLWEKVAPKPEKKKPVPFWNNGYFKCALIGVVAIGLFSAGYVTSKHYNNISDNIKEYVNNPTLTKSLVNAVNTTKPNEVLDTKTNVPSSTRNITPKENQRLGSSVTKQHTTVTTNNSIAIEKASYSDKSGTKELEKSTASSRIVKKEHLAVNNSFATTSNKASNISMVSEKALQPSIPVMEKENKADNTIEKSIESLFVPGDIVLSELALISEPAINKTLTTTPVLKNITPIMIHLPNPKNNGWSVEVYTSPDFDVKRVSTNNLNSSYLRIQDSSSKSIGGYTAGFRISKGISNNFSIKSGVQFKQSTERFNYSKQNDVKDITVINTRSYTDNSGATVYIIDTSVIQQAGGYTLRTVFNTYKSIEIPVLASWEKGNNKWHVSVNGGVILNLATYYEGQTYNNVYNVVPLSGKKSTGFFKSNANCSLYGGLSLLYNIGKGMDFFAEPYYRYALGNNSTSSIGYNQRFNSAGITFGVRYKIPNIRSNK